MKSLDEIMSREGEAMPEREEPASPAIETPQVEEAPAPAEVSPEAEGVEELDESNSPALLKALHESRAKGRKYTEELAATNRRLDELQALLTQARQQPQPQAQPQQPQAPAEVPDWYADPDKAFEHHAQQALDPVRQALMFNARLTAEAIFKPETVKAAEEAFNAAARAGQMDPEIYRRINSSPNPFHAAVQWHQHVTKQQAFSKYGDDPDAAIEAEVQRRLAALQGGQPQPSPQTAQAMPTSFSAGRSAGPRTAPTWSGPKPLSEIMNGR